MSLLMPMMSFFSIKNDTFKLQSITLNSVTFCRIKQQPRFPAFTKNHAHLFLHACLWNLEDAKKALYKYAHIHATAPDIFDNRDVLSTGVQLVLNMT